jgi:hypothetical protein
MAQFLSWERLRGLARIGPPTLGRATTAPGKPALRRQDAGRGLDVGKRAQGARVPLTLTRKRGEGTRMTSIPPHPEPPEHERCRTVPGEGKEADEEDRIAPDVGQASRIRTECLTRSQMHEGRPADSHQGHGGGEDAKVKANSAKRTTVSRARRLSVAREHKCGRRSCDLSGCPGIY